MIRLTPMLIGARVVFDSHRPHAALIPSTARFPATMLQPDGLFIAVIAEENTRLEITATCKSQWQMFVSPEVPVIVAGAEVFSAPAGDRLVPSGPAPIVEER